MVLRRNEFKLIACRCRRVSISIFHTQIELWLMNNCYILLKNIILVISNYIELVNNKFVILFSLTSTILGLVYIHIWVLLELGTFDIQI